jgi:hypothetical protein
MGSVGIFYGHLDYFWAVWYVLWLFGNVVIIWYIFHLLGYQEISDNPATAEF